MENRGRAPHRILARGARLSRPVVSVAIATLAAPTPPLRFMPFKSKRKPPMATTIRAQRRTARPPFSECRARSRRQARHRLDGCSGPRCTLRSAPGSPNHHGLPCFPCFPFFSARGRSCFATANCSLRSASSTRSRRTRSLSPIENSVRVFDPTILRRLSRNV